MLRWARLGLTAAASASSSTAAAPLAAASSASARTAYTLQQAQKDAKAAGAPRVTNSKYNYVHEFSITELSKEDFLKQVTAVESRLIDKFGSTCSLRVTTATPPENTHFQLLRSAFVHKRAQDPYTYRRYTHKLRVSYSFELTDSALNAYVYEQLKHCLMGCSGIRNLGYRIVNQGSAMAWKKTGPVSAGNVRKFTPLEKYIFGKFKEGTPVTVAEAIEGLSSDIRAGKVAVGGKGAAAAAGKQAQVSA